MQLYIQIHEGELSSSSLCTHTRSSVLSYREFHQTWKIFLSDMDMQSVNAASLWSRNNTTSLLFNSSDFSVSADWDLIHIIIPPYIFTLSLLGLFFNGFVLAVFAIHKDQLTVAEIYLNNLALADFILLCGLPLWGMYILNGYNWVYGDILCKIVNFFIMINFYTGIYTLVAISIDRYFALVKPMKARWLRRTVYAKVCCLIIWILGLLLSMPSTVHRKEKYIEEYEITTCVLDYSHGSCWKLSHQILLNVFGFVLPVLVIVFSSYNIIKALGERKLNRDFHDTNDTKTISLLCAVTILFLLCWGPFHVFTFLDTLCDIQVLDEALWFHTLDVGGQVSVYLGFLNSTLNPLLYVFYGQYFWKKFRAIYRRARRQHKGSDMTTCQRSVVSTYFNKTDKLKPVVIFNAKS